MYSNTRVEAYYETDRGAGMMRAMTAAALATWLPRQKRIVNVYLPRTTPTEERVQVGGVEWCTRPHEGIGGTRPHWCWWWEGLEAPQEAPHG